MRELAFAAILFVFLGTTLAQENGWSPAQREVWGREEAYWNALKSHDKEAYLSLLDDVFLSWPSYAKSPVGKNPLRERPLRVIDSYTFEQKIPADLRRHGHDLCPGPGEAVHLRQRRRSAAAHSPHLAKDGWPMADNWRHVVQRQLGRHMLKTGSG